MVVSFIVFSDLDGTLLDERDYGFAASHETVMKLKRASIPLVLVTSKTSAEIRVIQEHLGICESYAVENGGAVYLHESWAGILGPDERGNWRPIGPFLKREIGIPVTVAAAFIEQNLPNDQECRTFLTMTDEEVAEATDLTLASARLARQREYDLPFICRNFPVQIIGEFRSAAMAAGFQFVQGGRFFHLSGRHDKGIAVSILARIWRTRFPHLISIGLGDAENDIPMLARVDHPVLIRKRDGSVDPGVRASLPHAWIPSIPGPAGWSEAVERFIFSGGDYV